MKTVYYVSPGGTSGYAEAGKDYMVALKENGVDVWHKRMVFDIDRVQSATDRDRIVEDLQHKQIHYDNVIVHTTPEHWDLQREECNAPHAKKIGLTVWETTRLYHSWPGMCNAMDHVIVPCEWNVDVFRESGVTVPISVAPHILRPQPEVQGTIPGTEGRYVFYTIGQWSMRKGVHDTIRAYLSAFTADDDVALVVKTFASNYTPSEKAKVENWVKMIMAEFSRPAKVILLLDQYSQLEMEALHTAGDCYVSLCKAEGWGLGAFDAAGRGKPVIMTGFGGQMDFLKVGQHGIVEYDLVPVRGMPWIPWYTQDQQWAQPRLDHAVRLMRDMNERRPGKDRAQIKWMQETFSGERVAEMIKEVLA